MIIKIKEFMKYKIAFFLIAFSSISAAPSFTTSVYWQVPVTQSNAQFMFSNQDPSLMLNSCNSLDQTVYNNSKPTVYTFKDIDSSKPITRNADMILVPRVFNKDFFSQSVEGPYFTNNSSSFYIIGPTAAGLRNINIVKFRLASLGTMNVTSPNLSSAFNYSLNTMLKLLPYIKGDNSGFNGGNGTYGSWNNFYNWQGTHSSWQHKPSNWNNEVWKLNPKKIQSKYILSTLVRAFKLAFDSSTINQETHITASNFKAIPGVKMLLSTYFGKTIDFKLHLITPGKQGSIDSLTSLVDVMNRQRTYTEDYSMEGESPCKDNFGF